MSKPLDVAAAEALLDLCAIHGVAEVLDYLAAHYRTLPEGFDKPMTACVKLANGLDDLAEVAKAADAEVDAG